MYPISAFALVDTCILGRYKEVGTYLTYHGRYLVVKSRTSLLGRGKEAARKGH
jgi:hypothetical protein